MDPDPSSITTNSNPIIYIILLIVLVALNAFFSMSEMAVISVNENKIGKMAETGNKKAKQLLALTKDPNNFLSTIQIGVTLSGFLASAVAADTFADMIVNSFASRIAFMSESTLRSLSIILITIVLSYFTLILGELVPKRIAMQNPERISIAVVGVLSRLTKILTPIVAFLSMSTNGVLRLIGVDPEQHIDEVTEEEIRIMLDVGNERGSIDESEKEMIHNIFEFDDRSVDEIMTHRTEVIAVDINTSLDEILVIAVEHGYSRIPIYIGDLDNIQGILYVKDLLAFATSMSESKSFKITEFLRTPLFVIESNTCQDLLTKFQESKIHLAIVVDEYGGTAGLVTMEDLLEAIVGNIQDEYDNEEEEILQLDDGHYQVDGLTPLEDVVEMFGLTTITDDDDFDTIGGYVLSLIGQIPGVDEKPFVEVENLVFTVQEMDERRIAKLFVEVFPMDIEEEDDEDDDRKSHGKKKNRHSDKDDD